MAIVAPDFEYKFFVGSIDLHNHNQQQGLHNNHNQQQGYHMKLKTHT